MPNVKPSDIKPFARIKVLGVGGSGNNAVTHMVNSKVEGVEFICMNTDTQDLHKCKGDKKIHIGKNLTKGLGAGMDPEVGRGSAEETKAEIQEALKGADMAFIACGMGGGTGTGAAPVIASLAKEQNILTVAVVTKPFFFEGQQRADIAEKGIENLEKSVDALIVIPNDRLLSVAGDDMGFQEAFAMSDEILLQAVKGISELITTPGKINIDYADIQAVLTGAGNAFMGIGTATGQDRAQEAALAAINSPLLDISIDGAKGVLFAISGGADLKMNEIHAVSKIVTESIDPQAKVIFGAIEDTNLKKGEIKVTVIATGFDVRSRKRTAQPTLNFSARRATPAQQDITPAEARHVAEEEEMEEEIDSMVSFQDKQPEITVDEQSIESITIDGDDDNWSAVPAFLRRKK